MRKRILCMFMALCMIASLLPFTAAAADIVDSGTCGKNVTWTLDSDGLLTISGSGPMNNYGYSDHSPFFENELIRTVVIEPGVTSIGNRMFQHCIGMTNISIPNSVTTIGNTAFYECESLTSIVIPDSVTSIGSSAFYDCKSLTDVTLGNGISTIEDSTFYNCESLKSLNIPENVTSIGKHVFASCESLMTIQLPDGLTSIGWGSFDHCESLMSVVIPASVKDIPVHTFDYCTSLEKVTMLGVQTIGTYAFFGCTSLYSIFLPNTLEEVSSKAFQWTDVLTNVYYGGTSSDWKKISIAEDGNDTLLNANKYYKANADEEIPGAPKGPTKNGDATYNYLKEYVIKNGTLNSYLYSLIIAQDTHNQVHLAYDTKNDQILIMYVVTNGTTRTITGINVPPDLSMPYSATFIVQTGGVTVATVETKLDYTFTKESDLVLENGTGEYQLPEVKSLFTKGISACLMTLQAYVLNDTNLSIGDLGFNYYADSIGSKYDVDLTPPHTHNLSAVAKVEATCNADGTEAYWKCEECGSLFSDADANEEILSPVTIPALGHDWSDWEESTPATEENEGLETHTCVRCGESENRIIPKLGHTHILRFVPQVDATCTNSGAEAYWKCDKCGKLFSDAQGNNAISAPVEIAAVGHHTEIRNAKSASCTQDGYTGDEICSTCGETVNQGTVIKATGHKWDAGKVTKQPTEAAEGTKTFTCTVCGETRTESIPKLTPVTPPTPTNPFVDVKQGEYYYDPVLWAVNHQPQITNGTSATTFSPDATCTRGQVVTFLWRAMGQPEPTSTTNPFTDVPSNEYYYKAVLWAVEKGITNGTSPTTFSPNAPCTRAHVVTFLWRAEGQPVAGSSNPFSDVPSGQYYTSAVLWAVSKNITNGTSATTFSPDAPCTRGQIVTFLYRDMK